MLDTIAQIAITILGVTSIILVARKNKWGFVIALLAQPFWFVTSYAHAQWGIFFVSIIYTGSWAYGVYEWFWKSKPKKS